jgi:hypothetical protein
MSAQRLLSWNSATSCGCKSRGKALSWADFTVDHIDPHNRRSVPAGQRRINVSDLQLVQGLRKVDEA